MNVDRQLALILALFAFWACGEVAAEALYPVEPRTVHVESLTP